MGGVRQGIAVVVGPVLWVVAAVFVLVVLDYSYEVASYNASVTCGATERWCPSALVRVLVGVGLSGLGLAACGLIALGGAWLFRYAQSDAPRGRWRMVLAPVAGLVLLAAWAFLALLVVAKQGAFS